MAGRRSRWVVPALAALAVLLVIAMVWQQRPGSSGSDAGVAGGDSGQSTGSGGGQDGRQGTEPADPEPGDPDGDLEPVPDAEPGGGRIGGVAEGTIPVTGYHVYDPTHLALVYTNGVPACYGSPGTPVVEESAGAVTVTIPRIPPKSTGEDVACIDIAIVDSVRVTLEAPLGGREVRDGASDGAPRLPRQSVPRADPAPSARADPAPSARADPAP